MRAPLSWLRDFAPFDEDPADLAATLDDLGLVVDGVERVGEGLEDIVVARVHEITGIEGADRIRLTTVDAGDGPLEVVCGAWNFGVGDLVPLAPVGATLPGGMQIARRKMKGVASNGMLCSGRELALSDDHEGILVMNDVEGVRPGMPLTEALGIERDVVFEITVEGNRPDAWSIAGVARDLAARLHLPFTLPVPAPAPSLGTPVASLASLEVAVPALCPRMVVRVVGGVSMGPSPRWMARRLLMAGMRPINHVVDVSNYVMLELGQPNHPYDLDRLPGAGLVVRRAEPGERVTTLDGVERVLGTPGRGLGDTGEDCLICDAEGQAVGVGGIMGGERAGITDSTSRVLLEVAYFTPMAVARTSKRLGLRTEASARFERGCDPAGIDRAAARFCELLGAPVADGSLDARGVVPAPRQVEVPVSRIEQLLGVAVDADEAASLLEPLGFGCQIDGQVLSVTVPTDRPDVRPEPRGVADVIEEIARTYGYSRIPRRTPSWPEPGGLTSRQRDRRSVADAMAGVGALESWTPTMVDDADHVQMGLTGRAVAIANPMTREEGWLRRSMLPGLVRALAHNANRRQGAVRLFEIGTVFAHPSEHGRKSRGGAEGAAAAVLPGERELLSAVFAGEGDDARTAVAVWRVLADALRLSQVAVVADERVPGTHPTRTARLCATGREVGAVGEVDPVVTTGLGLEGHRVGWLEVDLGQLLDPSVTPRLPEDVQPFSRFPSSDVDLAFVVPDGVAASRVHDAIVEATTPLLEVATLFDVYRGHGVPAGSRSLAYRLRFCAMDRTLTDHEVGALRQAAIDAAAAAGATLR